MEMPCSPSESSPGTAGYPQVRARLLAIESEGKQTAPVVVKRIEPVRVAELTGTAASYDPQGEHAASRWVSRDCRVHENIRVEGVHLTTVTSGPNLVDEFLRLLRGQAGADRKVLIRGCTPSYDSAAASGAAARHPMGQPPKRPVLTSAARRTRSRRQPRPRCAGRPE